MDRVARPGEEAAPWSSLALVTAQGPDTLYVLTDGSLAFHAGIDSLSSSGLLTSAQLRGLEHAVAQADVVPLGAIPDGAGGAVVLERGGERLGFIWNDPGELDGPRQALVTLLADLRNEALGEGSERVAIVPTYVFASGRHAQVAERSARVIRDRDAFLALITGELRDEVLVVPEVDFTRDMLLVVFAGDTVRPGSQVEVSTQVSRTVGGYLLVPVTLHEPGEACAGSGVESPFHMVRLQRMEVEIFFDWERLQAGCPEEGR